MVPTVQLSQSAIFFCWRCASDAFQHVAMCIQLQPKRPTLIALLHVSQEVDHLGRPLHQQPQQQLRPFLPTGRNSSPDMLLRGQAADLLAGLDATLSKDWPQSFIKVCRTSPNSLYYIYCILYTVYIYILYTVLYILYTILYIYCTVYIRPSLLAQQLSLPWLIHDCLVHVLA